METKLLTPASSIVFFIKQKSEALERRSSLALALWRKGRHAGLTKRKGTGIGEKERLSETRSDLTSDSLTDQQSTADTLSGARRGASSLSLTALSGQLSRSCHAPESLSVASLSSSSQQLRSVDRFSLAKTSPSSLSVCESARSRFVSPSSP